MGGIDFNGVNGGTPISGTGTPTPKDIVKVDKDVDFGFETTAVGDVASFTTKPAFTKFDMEQMWSMAGVTKPDGMKSLENTMAFASEGAEYGVMYSEDDMNLARFMFENLK